MSNALVPGSSANCPDGFGFSRRAGSFSTVGMFSCVPDLLSFVGSMFCSYIHKDLPVAYAVKIVPMNLKGQKLLLETLWPLDQTLVGAWKIHTAHVLVTELTLVSKLGYSCCHLFVYLLILQSEQPHLWSRIEEVICLEALREVSWLPSGNVDLAHWARGLPTR